MKDVSLIIQKLDSQQFFSRQERSSQLILSTLISFCVLSFACRYALDCCNHLHIGVFWRIFKGATHMPSIYDLKPAFQNLLRPFSNWLRKRGVTPNQVTVTAVIISLLAGSMIALSPTASAPMLLVPIVLLVRMILNAIDGMLAREHNMQSSLGIFLNELGDVLSDIFIFLPFTLVPGISAYLIVFIVLLATISEMSGVVAIQAGGHRHYEGPMGKSDRAFIFGILGLLLGAGFQAGIIVNAILCCVIILLIITIVNRVKNSLREVKNGT